MDDKGEEYCKEFMEINMTLMKLLKINNPSFDRSGLLCKNSRPFSDNIPDDIYTSKSYEEIIDERAMDYIGRNPLVSWSGGIDSTTIVASFIKNGIDFSISVNDRSRKEYEELYQYFIDNRFDLTEVPNDLNFSSIRPRPSLILTGEINDQLYPSLIHNLVSRGVCFKECIVDKDYSMELFDTTIDIEEAKWDIEEQFINSYRSRVSDSEGEAEKFYNKHIIGFIKRSPIKIDHYYQLKWFLKFIFKYDSNLLRYHKIARMYPRSVEHFYNTDDFQRWSLTNLDYNFENYSKNYKTYKMPNKEYNYSVLGMESLLEQTKYPSL